LSTLERSRIEEKIVRNFFVSIFFHVLVIAAFSIKFVFFPDEAILIESAVRVDIVGLPEKMQQLPPPLTEPADATKKTPPPTAPDTKPSESEKKADSKTKAPPEEKAINLNKTKDRQKQALDKLKALEALEKVKKEVAQQGKSQADQPRPVRGNVLSAGTALTGVNQLQYEQYFGQLDIHIKNYWSLPEFMQNRDLKTQVRIQFDENGFITSKVITRSSGNAEYDNFVLDSIQRASPLPAPPEKFRDIVKYKGVILGFPE
jgi:colicin import membrane protein